MCSLCHKHQGQGTGVQFIYVINTKVKVQVCSLYVTNTKVKVCSLYVINTKVKVEVCSL